MQRQVATLVKAYTQATKLTFKTLQRHTQTQALSPQTQLHKSESRGQNTTSASQQQHNNQDLDKSCAKFNLVWKNIYILLNINLKGNPMSGPGPMNAKTEN